MPAGDFTYREPAWAAWCPVCFAEVGHACTMGDRIVPSHKARVDNAHGLQRAADYVYALYVLDEVAREHAWQVAGGDERW